MWNSGQSVLTELANILPRAVTGGYFAKKNRKMQVSWQDFGQRVGKFGRPWLSQRSRSRWWRILDLLDLSIPTEDHTLLSRSPGRIVRKLVNVEFNVVEFVRWNVLSLFTKLNLLKWFSFFIENNYWESERTRQMTDQEDNISLGKIACADNNQKRTTWACLGQTCSRSLNVFLSQLFVFLLNMFSCVWRRNLPKFFDDNTVCVGILCSAAG